MPPSPSDRAPSSLHGGAQPQKDEVCAQREEPLMQTIRNPQSPIVNRQSVTVISSFRPLSTKRITAQMQPTLSLQRCYAGFPPRPTQRKTALDVSNTADSARIRRAGPPNKAPTTPKRAVCTTAGGGANIVRNPGVLEVRELAGRGESWWRRGDLVALVEASGCTRRIPPATRRETQRGHRINYLPAGPARRAR